MSDALLSELLERLRQGNRYEDVIAEAERLTGDLPEHERDLIFFSLNAVISGLDPQEHVESPRQPDLTLYMDDIEGEVRADSPPRLFNHNRRPRGVLKQTTVKALNTVRDEIHNLFYADLTPSEIQEALVILGRQVRDLLPELTLHMIDDPRLKRLDLQLAPELDFPIELCWIENEGFLCDKVEISRWYTDGNGLFEDQTIAVDGVALVEGDLTHGFAKEEQAVLTAIPNGRHAKVRSSNKVKSQVFARSDHRLMHYKGHIGKSRWRQDDLQDVVERIPPRLSMAEGRSLKMSEIGAMDNQRKFFEKQPVVVLNGCDGALRTEFIGGESSFPRHLQGLRAAVIVATNWQVSETPASEFSAAFYSALMQSNRVTTAIKHAREVLLKEAWKFKEAKSSVEFRKYYLTAYGYVYYGPSDLGIDFEGK
ncbi:MAG: CHAT domain-containing protein [Pseudomonadota bacterium]